MPLYINKTGVTVVRDGRRLKVAPSGNAFEFTAEEVAAVQAAGGQMMPFEAAKGPQVIVAGAAPASKAEATSAKAKRKSKTSDDDGEDDETL
jgi:hypothetical protein